MSHIPNTAPAAVLARHPSRRPVPTDRRRWLQLALAALWVFDGLLQYQTYMFSKDFSASFLAGTADGNPGWVASSIRWAAKVVGGSPVLFNAGFATLQLGIGLAIAFRPTLRVGLGVSIVWSLGVWWFGEGLGKLLTGDASALAGAPGAVLLYAVLALLLWPTQKDTSQSFVAAQPIGTLAAKTVWVVLWGGLAALNLQPSQLSADSVSSTISGMGDGQPGWVSFLINTFAETSAHKGETLSVLGAATLALVAAGIFLPRRWARTFIVAAVVAAALIWVIGEALGAPFGGQGTDVNSGPLLALIALAYWPTPTRAVIARAGVSA